jgi:zinc/manganese transport system substrate-binding protein
LYNPHIWLDPKRVVQQVQTIRDGLIASDPDGKTLYTANAAMYIEQLKELDAETTQLLLPYANKTFVAFHDFAPYFAQSYNLNATFLVDVPNENPSPEDVKRIVNTVKQTQLKAILTEPQAGERIFATLSKDLAIQVSVFDPLETAPVDGIPPNYYLTTMRQNVKTLLAALTGKSTVLQAPSNWYGFTQPWVIIPQRVAIRF